MARLVGVLWDNNDPPNHPSSDCMTNEPPHYFNDACFDTLDPWVKTATDNGIWVVLAVRAQVGAGQYYDTRPGTVVFRNSTLKMMFYAMWSHVADHYASFDRIAVRPTPTSTSSQVWITCNVFFLFLLFYLGFGCYANLTDLLLCAPTTTDFNLNFLFRRMRFYRSLVTNQSAKMWCETFTKAAAPSQGQLILGRHAWWEVHRTTTSGTLMQTRCSAIRPTSSTRLITFSLKTLCLVSCSKLL